MKIALLGSSDSPLLAECHEKLRKVFGNEDDLLAFYGVGELRSWLETVSFDPSQSPPDLVVVAQDFTGQFLEEEVNSLLGMNPLVHWVCCVGPWAESDGRNGRCWPIAVCCSVARLERRLQREKEVIDGKVAPLALTATRNERFLFETDCEVVRPQKTGSVGLLFQDQVVKNFYRELLKSEGYEVLVDGIEKAAVCLCDLDPWQQVESRLSLVPRGLKGGQLLLGVTNEISPAVQSRMMAAGVHRVLPKLGGELQLLEELADFNQRVQVEPVSLSKVKTA